MMKKVIKGTYQGYYAIPYSKNMFGDLIVNVVYDPRELDVNAHTPVKGKTRVFLPESFLEGYLSQDMIRNAAKLAAQQNAGYTIELG